MRRGFDRLATGASLGTESPIAFIAALALVVLWACSYPLWPTFDTFQLVINTGTTIITFLMVFLVQHTQGKDTRALQTKLDAALDGIDRLLATVAPGEENAVQTPIGIEKLDTKALGELRDQIEGEIQSRPRS